MTDRYLAVVVALSLLLAGCAGNAGEQAAGGAADAGTSTPPPTTATAADESTTAQSTTTQTRAALDGTATETDRTEATQTVAPGRLALATVHVTSEKDTDEALSEQYVVVENVGGQPVELSGYTIGDDDGNRYQFPMGTTLAPGETLKLVTGPGDDGEGVFYWDAGESVWEPSGDTVVIRDRTGTVVFSASY